MGHRKRSWIRAPQQVNKYIQFCCSSAETDQIHYCRNVFIYLDPYQLPLMSKLPANKTQHIKQDILYWRYEMMWFNFILRLFLFSVVYIQDISTYSFTYNTYISRHHVVTTTTHACFTVATARCTFVNMCAAVCLICVWTFWAALPEAAKWSIQCNLTNRQ